MAHIITDTVLSAEVYNSLLVNHDATEQSARLRLKLDHVPNLAKILAIHRVSDYVELHLLHRHFILHEGEAILHRPCVIPSPNENTNVTVDIAKAVPCLGLDKSSLFLLMWMTSLTKGLVPYEYTVLEDASSQHRKAKEIPLKTWEAFAKDFSTQVRASGLQDIVSLKDKSCATGGEYVVPSMRVLFRIPYSIINLQASSWFIETGWAVEHNAAFVVDGPSPVPVCTDMHVTRIRSTNAGAVAHYHI